MVLQKDCWKFTLSNCISRGFKFEIHNTHTHISEGGESKRNLFLGIGSYACGPGRVDLQAGNQGRVGVAEKVGRPSGGRVFLPEGGQSLLLGPSTVLMRPTHAVESHLLYLKSIHLMLVSAKTVFTTTPRPVFEQTFGCCGLDELTHRTNHPTSEE